MREAHDPSHPDDGLGIRGTATFILGKSLLHAVPAARQRPFQDDHVLKSAVYSLTMQSGEKIQIQKFEMPQTRWTGCDFNMLHLLPAILHIRAAYFALARAPALALFPHLA